MDEIVPGIFHWTAKHPSHGFTVHCHYSAASRTAFDPLLPDEGAEWFDDRGLERIVLSTRHHLRHAAELSDRFGCPILAHESGLYEFEDGPAVTGFAFGDRLAADVVALEMNTISPDDTVLRIEAAGGALLFADSVVNADGLGFVPDHLIGDDPESVKRGVRERCARLAEEESFDALLFAHGKPLPSGGREALRDFSAG